MATKASNALTIAWAERIPSHESTVFSGLGVWPLLGLLATGAAEPARSELAAAYGLDPALADTTTRRFLHFFDHSPALRAALGLWLHEDRPVVQSWLDALPPATRGRLTGDPAADAAAMSAWAREHTRGLIEHMPAAPAQDTGLVLATALAVQTAWLRAFSHTTCRAKAGPWSERPRFAALSRRTAPDTVWNLACGPGVGQVTATVVQGADDIDVLLFLGEPDATAGQVVAAGIAAVKPGGLASPPVSSAAAVSGTAAAPASPVPETASPAAVNEPVDALSGPGITVRTVRSSTPGPIVMLTVPPFTIRAEHDVLRHADIFGLTAASSRRRGLFPGISSADLVVGSAGQRAMAEFTATGFRAAVVTAAEAHSLGVDTARCEAEQYDVTYDRPFGFAAVYRPTGLVIVAGWVADVG